MIRSQTSPLKCEMRRKRGVYYAAQAYLAPRPKDSSLDKSKASRYLDEKLYNLDKALSVLKEEMENAKNKLISEKY